MSDDFKQTVDLKTELESKKKAKQSRFSSASLPLKKSEEIDEVFNDKEKKDNKADLQSIKKYEAPKVNENAFRKVVIGLAIILVAVISYFLFFRGTVEKKPDSDLNWYAVKLTNSEIYYGQIDNTAADPVVIKNVYYDYDQLKEGGTETKTEAKETGNIRLVKRGQETHGPAGSMDVVRSQVVYMELLKEDSKVLKAILNYEKQN